MNDQTAVAIDISKELVYKFSQIQNENNSLQILINKETDKLMLLSKVSEFLISFNEFVREKFKGKIENIVNSALASVFKDKTLRIKIIGNQTKRGLVYNLFIETDGIVTSLYNAKGGGVLDIINLAIRIAFLRLFKYKLRQVLILDEPFKNLDSERIHDGVQWLSIISKEFGIQMIIITHIKEMLDYSNNNLEFKLIDGVTNCYGR